MKKTIFIIISIFLLFVIQNLFHSIYSLWQKQELLVKAAQQLEKEKAENAKLKRQMEWVKKPSFIEQQARDKLLLVKPGEQIVVYSRKPEMVKPSSDNITAKLKPNWLLWWELFVKPKQ